MGKKDTGYHYTTPDAWEHIQLKGLQPYYIPRLREVLPDKPASWYGIWVWPQELLDDDLEMYIRWQLQSKHTNQIVKAKVWYEAKDLWDSRWMKQRGYHTTIQMGLLIDKAGQRVDQYIYRQVPILLANLIWDVELQSTITAKVGGI